MRKDPELGKLIAKVIQDSYLEGPYKDNGYGNWETQGEALLEACIKLTSVLQIDLGDESTHGTPKRLASMYLDEVCYGMDYNNFPAMMLIPTESHNLVLERNCLVHSLCEHHFLPIIGVAHVAYIPDKTIIGLSKINRIVDFFSRRPQLQERLGEQIAYALQEILKTNDVAVVIRADHLCTKFRGIKDPESDTITSSMHGKFFTVPQLRAELMELVKL